MAAAGKVKFVWVVWVVMFTGSLVLHFWGDPVGSGLYQQLGKGFGLIATQVVAAGLATLCWSMARGLPESEPMRRLGHLPILATFGLVFVAIASVVLAVRNAG